MLFYVCFERPCIVHSFLLTWKLEQVIILGCFFLFLTLRQSVSCLRPTHPNLKHQRRMTTTSLLRRRIHHHHQKEALIGMPISKTSKTSWVPSTFFYFLLRHLPRSIYASFQFRFTRPRHAHRPPPDPRLSLHETPPSHRHPLIARPHPHPLPPPNPTHPPHSRTHTVLPHAPKAQTPVPPRPSFPPDGTTATPRRRRQSHGYLLERRDARSGAVGERTLGKREKSAMEQNWTQEQREERLDERKGRVQ
jgi:hypothetical protein